MTATRFTYAHLVELVDGDHELISLLVEEGEIERRADDRAMVDVDRVLTAHTLLRELDIAWPGIEVILRLRGELIAARRRIDELEHELADRAHGTAAGDADPDATPTADDAGELG